MKDILVEALSHVSSIVDEKDFLMIHNVLITEEQ